ncbi:MAG: dihydroorotase [Deltaproteobacteria bacterium]|nr:MAG: dihydroorotase [Deltaproteobacteria bacterium]
MIDLPRGTSNPEIIAFTSIRAIDPAQQLDGTVDIVVEQGRITRLGAGAATAELKGSDKVLVVDGAGLWALPAFVDLHVHFREPGHEYKEDIASGLAAAAAGGFGHVCPMPNTKPVNDTRSITEAMVARAERLGGPKLHPVGAITCGLKGEALTEMADLRDAGAVAVSDDGRCVHDSAMMRRALEYARTFELPVIQHAEDHRCTKGAQMHEGVVATRLGLRGWPRAAEDTIVARDLLLVEATGARYHVAHISTAGAIRLVREAKARGLPVTAEVTPHHLMLTHEAVSGYDPLFKVNPPLREQADLDACRAALIDGTIDAIATDHAPHSSMEKECEFMEAAPGLIGLELVVPVLLELVRTDQLPLQRFVTALTSGPAAVIDIEPPSLRVGATVELVVIDPAREHQVDAASLKSKSCNSPFVGRTHTGSVELTLLGHELAYVRPTKSQGDDDGQRGQPRSR